MAKKNYIPPEVLSRIKAEYKEHYPFWVTPYVAEMFYTYVSPKPAQDRQRWVEGASGCGGCRYNIKQKLKQYF